LETDEWTLGGFWQGPLAGCCSPWSSTVDLLALLASLIRSSCRGETGWSLSNVSVERSIGKPCEVSRRWSERKGKNSCLSTGVETDLSNNSYRPAKPCLVGTVSTAVGTVVNRDAPNKKGWMNHDRLTSRILGEHADIPKIYSNNRVSTVAYSRLAHQPCTE
jgi:hypothetical protein